LFPLKGTENKDKVAILFKVHQMDALQELR
jgi:hypothetical protein